MVSYGALNNYLEILLSVSRYRVPHASGENPVVKIGVPPPTEAPYRGGVPHERPRQSPQWGSQNGRPSIRLDRSVAAVGAGGRSKEEMRGAQ